MKELKKKNRIIFFNVSALILLNIRFLFLPVTLDITTPDWATLETEDYSTTSTTTTSTGEL